VTKMERTLLRNKSLDEFASQDADSRERDSCSLRRRRRVKNAPQQVELDHYCESGRTRGCTVHIEVFLPKPRSSASIYALVLAALRLEQFRALQAEKQS